MNNDLRADGWTYRHVNYFLIQDLIAGFHFASAPSEFGNSMPHKSPRGFNVTSLVMWWKVRNKETRPQSMLQMPALSLFSIMWAQQALPLLNLIEMFQVWYVWFGVYQWSAIVANVTVKVIHLSSIHRLVTLIFKRFVLHIAISRLQNQEHLEQHRNWYKVWRNGCWHDIEDARVTKFKPFAPRYVHQLVSDHACYTV